MSDYVLTGGRRSIRQLLSMRADFFSESLRIFYRAEILNPVYSVSNSEHYTSVVLQKISELLGETVFPIFEPFFSLTRDYFPQIPSPRARSKNSVDADDHPFKQRGALLGDRPEDFSDSVYRSATLYPHGIRVGLVTETLALARSIAWHPSHRSPWSWYRV